MIIIDLLLDENDKNIKKKSTFAYS